MIFGVGGVFGCASRPSKPFAFSAMPQLEVAQIYVYRPWRFVGSGCDLPVFQNDVKIGELENGKYIVLQVAPGEHEIHTARPDDKIKWTCDFKFSSIKFNLTAGQRGFVAFENNVSSAMFMPLPVVPIVTVQTSNHFRNPNESEALVELKECEQQTQF